MHPLTDIELFAGMLSMSADKKMKEEHWVYCPNCGVSSVLRTALQQESQHLQLLLPYCRQQQQQQHCS